MEERPRANDQTNQHHDGAIRPIKEALGEPPASIEQTKGSVGERSQRGLRSHVSTVHRTPAKEPITPSNE